MAETLADPPADPPPLRRIGRARRLVAFATLGLLVLLGGGYRWATHPARVRGVAERVLSQAVGGVATVEGASLSIFEGLRLDGLTVRLPIEGSADPGVDDEPILSARSVRVGYEPGALLRGRIHPTRLVLLDARVRLVESADGRWNVERLRLPAPDADDAPAADLPEIWLRNARVEVVRPEVANPSGETDRSSLRSPAGVGVRPANPLPGGVTPTLSRLTGRGWFDGWHGSAVPGGPSFPGDNTSATGNTAAVAGNRASVAGNKARIAGNKARIAGNKAPIVGNKAPIAGNKAPIAGNRAAVAGNRAAVAGNRASVAGNKAPVAGNKAPVAGNRASVAGNKVPIAGNKLPVVRQNISVAGGHVVNARGRTPVVAVPRVTRRHRVVLAADERPGVGDGVYHPSYATRTDTVWLDGQLLPARYAGRYDFRLHAHQPGASASDTTDWPTLRGSLWTRDRTLTASIEGLALGERLGNLLPNDARRAWSRLSPTGRIDVPAVTLFRHDDGRVGVRCDVRLREVTLNVPASLWLGEAERGSEAGPAGRSARLVGVGGDVTFTEEGVAIGRLVGSFEGVPLAVSGRIGGYGPRAAAELTVRSLDGRPLYLPPDPTYLAWLPTAAREVHERFGPSGWAAVRVTVRKPPGDARPRVEGRIDLIDGAFRFEPFPYPLRGATGMLVFGPHPETGLDRLDVRDVRGRGIAGGVNESATVGIDGSISPLDGRAGFDVTIWGNDVSREPAIIEALPPPVGEALEAFDADGRGELPRFRGGFRCVVTRPPGRGQRWSFTTDLTLSDGRVKPKAFPYELHDVKASLRVTRESAEVTSFVARHGLARVDASGDVRWRDAGGTGEEGAADDGASPGVVPRLTIAVTGMPIDDDLLAALPVGSRAWLDRVGLTGRLEVDGTIGPVGVDEPDPSDDAGGFDLSATLTGGRARPAGAALVLSDLSSHLRLTPGRIDVTDLRARRGEGELRGDVRVTLPTASDAPSDAPAGGSAGAAGGPRVEGVVQAHRWPLDVALRDVLPAYASSGWDAIRPDGSADATVRFDYDAASSLWHDLRVDLSPRGVSVTPTFLPLTVTDVRGRVTLTPAGVRLESMAGRHDEGGVTLSGSGDFTEKGSAVWDLAGGIDRLNLSPTTIDALPAGLADVLRTLGASGTVAADVARVRVTPADAGVDVDLTVRPTGASFTSLLRMEGVGGEAEIAGSWRDGRLQSFHGEIDVPSLRLMGQPAEGLRATVRHDGQTQTLRLDPLVLRLLGGQVAGSISHGLEGGDAAGRYSADVAVRGVDLKALTAATASATETAGPMSGTLSAALTLEGAWDDATSRRGRGQVLVEGSELYRVPFLLGLTQLANLSLPINSPFRRAAARYSVDGTLVVIDAIDLSARDLRMSGGGRIDVARGDVHLTFTTSNPAWPKLPVIGGLLDDARRELLRIHVRGRLGEPRVSAGVLETFTTTVDEVLRAGE